jgi:hypothetical protein
VAKIDQHLAGLWQRELMVYLQHCWKDRSALGSIVAKRGNGLLATLWQREISTWQHCGKESYWFISNIVVKKDQGGATLCQRAFQLPCRLTDVDLA